MKPMIQGVFFMPKREPGPDLIRCLAFFFVVVFHSFLYNGYSMERQAGWPMLLSGSLRWLSVSCIGLFLMLSGYLKQDQDAKKCFRSLPPVLVGYLLAAVVSIPLRHFLLGDPQPLAVWLERLLSFRGVYYGWYVEMYVGLALLMPFVNLLLAQLKTTKQLLTLALILLSLTALPGATALPILPGYWKSIYPLTYYVLGAIIRRARPRVAPVAAISVSLVTALALGTATVLSTDGTIHEAFTQQFADLWIAVIAVSLFLGTYRVRLSPRLGQVLAFCAKGCYGGYLLSHLLDSWAYGILPQWHTPQSYWKLFFCVSIPIFAVSILLGHLLQAAAGMPFSTGRRVAA